MRKLYGMPREAVKLEDSNNAHAMTWVLKAGITPERASGEYGMRWSDKLERVLIPIYNLKREYTGLLGRSVSAGPKYILLQGKPEAYYTPVISKSVVITEDVLSAIAVHEAGTTAFAVLGTAIQNSFVELLAEYDKVVGWFDNDRAGSKAYMKLRRRLAMHDKQMVMAHSSVDPKYIPRRNIREQLDEIGV